MVRAARPSAAVALRRPAAAVRRVVVAALVAATRRRGERSGRVAGRVGGWLSTAGGHDRPVVLRSVDAGIRFLAAAGSGTFARGAIHGLAVADGRGPATLAHRLLLAMDDRDAAAALEARVADRPWATSPALALLEADRHLAAGDPDGAGAALDRVAVPLDRERARRRVEILRRSGRFDELLGLLPSLRPHLDGPTAPAAEFDAHWAVGRTDAALAAVLPAADPTLRDLGLLRRLRRGFEADGRSVDELVALVLPASSPLRTTADREWVAAVHLETGRPDRVIRWAGGDDGASLGPDGRFDLALARYVLRDFDGARALLPGLIGTRRHWDAEKLGARMLLEEGRAAEALRLRRGRRRLGGSFDDVELFSLLQLGRVDEGLAAYAHRSDVRRLTATFGSAAEERPTDHVPGRFVVPQNGPADEILLAATYERLADRSTALGAACDPRLRPLLERSFPDVRFVPAERVASEPQPGFAAPDRPPRALGALYDLLSAEAMSAATQADRVILGRSLVAVAPAGAPYAPYLVPDASRRVDMARRLGPRPIGIVWRSEFNVAIRSIHYLQPADLAPFAGAGRRFVCLQHDVTEAERRELTACFGADVQFLDDVDLRDDFDVAAAVVAACSEVVGIGTTMVELAAAVGTPTIALHPNRLGAWRARPDGGDFWHRTMRVAVSDDPRDRAGCVRRAAELLDPR